MAEKPSLEYYGSPEGMPQEILDARLQHAQITVKELETELSRRDAFTVIEKLADRLHKLLHFGVDCDYYYSKWPSPTGCRSEFKRLAEIITKHYEYASDPEAIKDYTLGGLIHFLEVIRFGK